MCAHPLGYGVGVDGLVDNAALAAFLLARARELPDPDDAEMTAELASEVREADSSMALTMGVEQAKRWADHPDYRDDWRIG